MAAPGEVSILALAACTNVARAIAAEPRLPGAWAELVILGGAFAAAGNVNPAAEANILGDPEAADFLFQHATRATYVVGLDVTHECTLSGERLAALRGASAVGRVVGPYAAACKISALWPSPPGRSIRIP